MKLGDGVAEGTGTCSASEVWGLGFRAGVSTTGVKPDGCCDVFLPTDPFNK